MKKSKDPEKRILVLPCNAEWWNKIDSGEVIMDYREIKKHWTERLLDKEFDEVHFKLGYRKNAKVLKFKWQKTVQGYYFGSTKYIICFGERINGDK